MPTMKAITVPRYGTPEVLRLADVARPEPQPGEVRVRVKAASLNALDKHLSRGVILARPQLGWTKPRDPILGSDFAGIVDAVGAGVSAYQPGDRVFGGRLQGAFAEYLCIDTGRMAHLPEAVTFEQAAALPVAAGTALQAFRKANIEAGHRILINGGSGGVGLFLVQLARHQGVHCTAVCSGRNVALVREHGADRVIDYQQESPEMWEGPFDRIIDNVGNLRVRDYQRLLTPTGNCIVMGMTSVRRLLGVMVVAKFVSRKSGQTIGMLDAKVNATDLATMADLVAQGSVKPFIERTYALDQVPDAMRYLWTRRVRGKLVVTL